MLLHARIANKEILSLYELIFYADLDVLFLLLDTHIDNKDIYTFMNWPFVSI